MFRKYLINNNITNHAYIYMYGFMILGSLIIISSFDLVALFLSLELFGLNLYILVAMKKNSLYSIEAAMKYFLQNSLASVFFISGTALTYLQFNSTHFIKNTWDYNIIYKIITDNLIIKINHFSDINTLFDNVEILTKENTNVIICLGLFFILIAMLIKLGVAPFHFWLPDVYEGAPMVTTFILSTIVKITYIFILFKLMFTFFNNFYFVITPFLIIVATISMLWGAILASKQKKIKRFLAYSSINHTGLILFSLSFIPFNGAALTTVLYVLTYIAANIVIFSFLLKSDYKWTIYLLRTYYKKPFFQYPCKKHRSLKRYIPVYYLRQIVYISDLNNFKNKNQITKIAVICALFSLGGMPPFAGFLSKFLVLYGLIGINFNYITVPLFIISSTISIIYYSKVVKCLSLFENTGIKTYINYPSHNNVKNYDIVIFYCLLFLFFGIIIFYQTFINAIYSSYFFDIDHYFNTYYFKLLTKTL